GVGPGAEYQRARAWLGAADHRRVARLRLDVRGQLRHAAAREPHVEAHRAAAHALWRDLELSVARHGPTLRRADGHLGAVALERGVVVVAEELAQLRQEGLEALVGGLRREARRVGRGAIAGQNDSRAEPDDRLRLGHRCQREGQQQRQDQDQERPEGVPQTPAGVVQPRHHGPHRYVQYLRDLAVRQPFEITQHDNGPVRLRQSGQRAPDPLALLDLRRVTVWRGPLIDQDAVPVLLVDALGAEGPAARRVLSGAVARDVHHDPKEPGVEGGVAAERRQRLEGA